VVRPEINGALNAATELDKKYRGCGSYGLVGAERTGARHDEA